MSFILTLLYLLLTLMTPKELVPALLPFRIVLIVFVLALITSSFSAVGNGFSFKAPQLVLLVGLVIYAAVSVLYALHWLSSAIDAVLDLLFLAGIVLAVSWNLSSPKRLRILGRYDWNSVASQRANSCFWMRLAPLRRRVSSSLSFHAAGQTHQGKGRCDTGGPRGARCASRAPAAP
jgi:hypothetical protein